MKNRNNEIKVNIEKVLELIERISSDAMTLHPERDWKESADAICRIYRIIHCVRAPKCIKNHPTWEKETAEAIEK